MSRDEALVILMAQVEALGLTEADVAEVCQMLEATRTEVLLEAVANGAVAEAMRRHATADGTRKCIVAECGERGLPNVSEQHFVCLPHIGALAERMDAEDGE